MLMSTSDVNMPTQASASGYIYAHSHINTYIIYHTHVYEHVHTHTHICTHTHEIKVATAQLAWLSPMSHVNAPANSLAPDFLLATHRRFSHTSVLCFCSVLRSRSLVTPRLEGQVPSTMAWGLLLSGCSHG